MSQVAFAEVVYQGRPQVKHASASGNADHIAGDYSGALPGKSYTPYARALTLDDVDRCVEVEDAAFPPNERASREKFAYRLGACAELSLGVFVAATGSEETASIIDGQAQQGEETLLGHIVSTMTDGQIVSDNDMAYPTSDNPDPLLGHKQHGRTVCLHSLAVLPGHQKQKLGSTLMRAYIERLKTHDLADSVALIAHDYLVPYYERFGFKNLGPSQAQFGGGGWYDMVLDLTR